MRRRLLFIVCSIFAVMLFSNELIAEIYKYVDENGRTIFVDDPSKIPGGPKKNLSVISERSDTISQEERDAYEEEIRLQSEDANQRSQLSRKERAEARAKKKRETTVRINGNRIIVPVRVIHGGKSASLNLLLDTGASSTVIYTSAVEKFHFVGKKRGQGRLAGGTTVNSTRVVLDKIKVGPCIQEDMPVWLIEDINKISEDGLLGFDFLSTFGYTVDMDRSVIIWGE